MTMFTDKLQNYNQPHLDKVDRDLRCKEQLKTVFDRTNDTTFSQSFLSGTGSRKVN